MLTELRRILLEACVLVAFGALVGLSLNYRLVIDAFTGHLMSPSLPTAVETREEKLPVPVLLEEVRQLDDTDALVIDARSPELYAAGHLPAAVSLPLVEVDTYLNDFISTTPQDRTLVVYCNGFGCPDSFDLALLLIEAGFGDVRVFEGGFPEWRDAGLPVVTEAP